MKLKSRGAMAISTQAPDEYEEKHVHNVYEKIASHFSSTRYKPWPIVHDFLLSLSPGSVGLDVGGGNGKYLTVNRDIFIIGSDRSSNLTCIAAQHQPHSAIVADNLALPHGGSVYGGRFDFAISIAVIHHLSTPGRRQEAIRSILECLKDEGKALIYVWALEQKNSRRGWDEGHDQDVMVPWVMKTGKQDLGNGEKSEPKETTFQRYYHLYRSGELEENIEAADGEVLQSGYEKDNWWAIATRKRSLE
jgi:tRNA (uracil-5-)-methyltransferase TRM9